jgi:hypothetical protein
MTARIAVALLAYAGVALGRFRTLAVSINADDITTGTPLDGFVSYSIELSSFPDFAGTVFLSCGYGGGCDKTE